MKPTWKVQKDFDSNSVKCKCLICGKKFIFVLEGHFNMRLIKCPTCNQQVWVPKCPNGCPSFDLDHTGDTIKFDDYITKDVKNEERH
ncbi:MAG: hypothetical protein IMF19_04615 [Proteobacteria bacterium]|nr:hypothetical protein [Pseudomonadota bacterium]